MVLNHIRYSNIYLLPPVTSWIKAVVVLQFYFIMVWTPTTFITSLHDPSARQMRQSSYSGAVEDEFVLLSKRGCILCDWQTGNLLPQDHSQNHIPPQGQLQLWPLQRFRFSYGLQFHMTKNVQVCSISQVRRQCAEGRAPLVACSNPMMQISVIHHCCVCKINTPTLYCIQSNPNHFMVFSILCYWFCINIKVQKSRIICLTFQCLSLGAPASAQSPKTCMLVELAAPVGVNVSVNGCLSLCVSPVIAWWSVHDASHPM